VPMGCLTLHQAVRKVEESEGRLTTIVVGEGTHMIKEKEVDSDDEDEFYENGSGGLSLFEIRMGQTTLSIDSSMNIIGEANVDKSKIVVEGKFRIGRNVEGNVHLEHMTVHASGNLGGVVGNSSFTLKDLIIEKCANRYDELHYQCFGSSGSFECYGTSNYDSTGLWAKGSSTVARCHNVIVRNCAKNGVRASGGASIFFSGKKTSVHNNCLDVSNRDEDDYCEICGLPTSSNEYDNSGECTCEDYCFTFGLEVCGPNSKIKLLAPLTKRNCAYLNGGGGSRGSNFGPQDSSNGTEILDVKEEPYSENIRVRLRFGTRGKVHKLTAVGHHTFEELIEGCREVHGVATHRKNIYVQASMTKGEEMDVNVKDCAGTVVPSDYDASGGKPVIWMVVRSRQ
jgi:hypothetical protein